ATNEPALQGRNGMGPGVSERARGMARDRRRAREGVAVVAVSRVTPKAGHEVPERNDERLLCPETSVHDVPRHHKVRSEGFEPPTEAPSPNGFHPPGTSDVQSWGCSVSELSIEPELKTIDRTRAPAAG